MAPAFSADAGAFAALGGQDVGVARAGITPAQLVLQPAGQRGVVRILGVAHDSTSAKLVHTSAGPVDAVEGLAEVVGEGVGGGDDMLADRYDTSMSDARRVAYHAT